MRQEAFAIRREGHSAGAAYEERSANMGFQPTDVAAQRLLRHVKAIGGSGEMKVLGDGHEGTEEAQIEFGRHASRYFAEAVFTPVTRESAKGSIG